MVQYHKEGYHMHENSNINPNEFTQKDLMLHLLQVTQHSATREDVKADIQELSSQIDKRFEQVDKRLEQVEKRFDELKDDNKALSNKIDKVDSKFDRLQWLIVATIIVIFAKDYLLKLIH
jgi:septal ring factor EnvC (AmiA/AmiB activator)